MRVRPPQAPSRPALRSRLALFAITAALFACGEVSVEDRLAEAQTMLGENRFDDAIAELRDVLDTHPEHPRANFMLALAFQRTNQPTLAVWPLEKAFTDDEYRTRAGLQLANLHLAMRNSGDAARAASRVLESEPGNVEAHRARARAYLMDKRFDEALADADWLVESEGSKPMGLVLRGSIYADMEKPEEAEKAFREAIALTTEYPADNERAWVVLMAFLARDPEDPEHVEAAFAEARAAYPDSPVLRSSYLGFLAEQDRHADAEAYLREEIEREPEDFQLRLALANTLSAQDRSDDAEAVLEQLTEEFPSAASWQLLGSGRLQEGDFEGARVALEKAVELAPSDEQLRFLLAEAQVRSGQTDAARELARSFERKPYQHFVEGLIRMEERKYAEALESFEMGLRNWPDNVGARNTAGAAAQGAGDWNRAIEEFTEAARLDMAGKRLTDEPFETEAALQLARIYKRRRNFQSALYWASVHIRHDPDDEDGVLLLASTLREQGSAEQARAAYRGLLGSPVDAEARAALTSLEFEAGNDAAAWKLVAEAQPGDLPTLAVAAEHEVDSGDLDAALARIEKARASEAYDAADLLALRGRVLHAGGRSEEAEVALREALEANPDDGATVAALATLRANAGDLEGAIASFARAAELQPENPNHPYHAGQLLLQLGRASEAEERLRAATRLDPGHAESRNDLAWLLSSDSERLDEALRIGAEAYRLNDASPFADTLGWIHYLRGDYPRAVDMLSRAASNAPEDAVIRYHLGMALARQGQSERALQELKAAVDTGGFSELESAQLEIARLEGVGS